MKTENSVQENILAAGLVPLFYHDDLNRCKEIISVLYTGGVRVIEFTNRGSNALLNFHELIAWKQSALPGLLLGAGTIQSAADANAFMSAEADFLVSPFFDADIADAAYMEKILWIPGCTTPTEIHVASNAGCSLIKLFPGNLLGPAYIKSIRPIFPLLQFMVTGGVSTDATNIKEWFNAGAHVLGMGSTLITQNVLDGNISPLTETTISVIKHIAAAKNK